MAGIKAMTLVAMALVAMTHSTGVSGQVTSAQCCPTNIEVVPNFDIPQYMGTWYEYAKYPTIFEGDGVCVKAEYTLQNDGVVAVKNSQVNAKNGSADEIVGTATVVSNGKLLVKFPFSPSFNAVSNYWVLDTDYCTYSVVYSCQDIDNQQSSTSVWILTRERLPTQDTIAKAKKVLTDNGISLDPLTYTNQSGCTN
uniref:Apolipoprotein D n=1 Tax=Stomoxys calcitrans TaxID=35570 RepID=A0A1I8PPQ0_STOCA